jgi:hypothetical protein
MSANDPRNAFRERIAAGSDLPAPYPPALPAALIVEAVLATAVPRRALPPSFIRASLSSPSDPQRDRVGRMS